jgi:hypothetical protein
MVGLYKDSIADSRAQDRPFPSNFTAPDQEADEPFSSSCLVWRAMQQAQKKPTPCEAGLSEIRKIR